MSVLAMPLSLGDGPGRIEDVEKLVRKVVTDRLRSWDTRKITEHDREDLHSFLIGQAWEISRRYDVRKDKKPNLAAYVAHILSLRVADWYRQRFGDTRHGDKPIVLSLDAPATLESGYPEADGLDRLVDTLPGRSGDPAEDRSPDLVGILNGTGGGRARADAAVGEPTGGEAARQARGPGSPRLVKPRVPPTFRATSKRPVCAHCYAIFLRAFRKVNAKASPATRLTAEQVEAKARKRAQAVRFGSKEDGERQWACPRCTKIEDKHGHELMLQQAYPNGAARRAAVKAKGKKGTVPQPKPKKRAVKHGGKGSRTSRARKGS